MSRRTFSDTDLERRAVRDGVENHLALRYLRQAQPGDEAPFYHTGSERAIVGVARVETEPYPDPEAGDEWIVVLEVSPRERLRDPVSLSRIKVSREFEDWELLRMPRLSVLPVPSRIWSRILAMSRA